MSINSFRLNRRQVFALMGAAAGHRVYAQDARLSARGLEHVSIQAADLKKSISFYRRLFSAELFKTTGKRRILVIGSSYLSIAPARESLAVQRRVDHISPAIEGFNTGRLKAQFEQQGLSPRVTDGSVYVKDPDGIEVQFTGGACWKQNPNAPDSVPGAEEPVFRPVRLDHLVLGMPDPDKSSAFYRSLFGPEAQRSRDPLRIWYQLGTARLGLSVQPGERTGVDHFAILVETFDPAIAAKKKRH